jgi:hypothetical protein
MTVHLSCFPEGAKFESPSLLSSTRQGSCWDRIDSEPEQTMYKAEFERFKMARLPGRDG